jgi:hypothetical protein
VLADSISIFGKAVFQSLDEINWNHAVRSRELGI